MSTARNKSAEKSRSFHGRSTTMTAQDAKLRRPKTVPELSFFRKSVAGAASPVPIATTAMTPRLTKLLLNVTIQGSVGSVQMVMFPASTVGDLISTAIRQYSKEGRRPFLPSSDPSRFDLHYSQFSLESLERDEKLMSLGSRNFFLCSKSPPPSSAGDGSSSGGVCSNETVEVTKTGFYWLKFIGFLL